MLLLRAQASQDRKGGRHEQLLCRDVERIVTSAETLCFTFLISWPIASIVSLRLRNILLNGFERGFADFQRDVDFRNFELLNS